MGVVPIDDKSGGRSKCLEARPDQRSGVSSAFHNDTTAFWPRPFERMRRQGFARGMSGSLFCDLKPAKEMSGRRISRRKFAMYNSKSSERRSTTARKRLSLSPCRIDAGLSESAPLLDEDTGRTLPAPLANWKACVTLLGKGMAEVSDRIRGWGQRLGICREPSLHMIGREPSADPLKSFLSRP